MTKDIAICLFSAVFLLPFSALTAQDNAPLDTSSFDQSTRPQDDLFQFVNGTWLKETDIPADKTNYGSFTKLADLSEQRIKAIIDELSKGTFEKGSAEQKVADFYRSFMNEESIEGLGVQPIEEMLQEVDALESKEKLFEHFAKLSKVGVNSPIGAYISVDAKNSSEYIVYLVQSGLTLPNRDFYLVREKEEHREAQAALATYINDVFRLASEQYDEVTAGDIIAFETRLANAQWDRITLRDAEKRYNKYKVEDLHKLNEVFDWDAWFLSSGISPGADVVVNTPSFFEDCDEIFKQTSLETLKAWTKFQIIDSYAPYLSSAFALAHFKLHRQKLGGAKEQRPRWKRAIESMSPSRGFGTMGELIGKIYVERYFKPEAKEKMDRLVKNLLKSFGDSIDTLSWMSDETRAKARVKLSKIETKIGYTNKWRDYSALEVEPDDLVGNLLRSAAIEFQREVDKLGKPIDREEWGMSPQTVNAYYNPTKNEIVFPAAILQPPFFSVNAPAPLNYGGIGAVIGHEISHAFDDQGSRYDGDGNLKNWWTEDDRKAFMGLASRLVKQYDGYEPLPGQFVKGQFTLGENIADLSGLEIAHKAMTEELAGKPPIEVAGWNQDQLFFVGWSRVWARKYRDQDMLQRLQTDPHSPSEFRANGPVTNIDAFYKAFGLKEGDRLFKSLDQRIQIW